MGLPVYFALSGLDPCPRSGTTPDNGLRAGLRGRASECALLDDLVAAIGRGESRSLVLRGEAGIGKTALLEYVIASASVLTVVRAVGVESDMEVAFASLRQLCGPLLDRLPKLPASQRQAMETAFGLSTGGAPDRFLVGLAVLSLFAAVGEERPLGATEWLNSEPRGPAELRAHVVRERERDAIGFGEVRRSVSYTVASTSRRMASSVAATS